MEDGVFQEDAITELLLKQNEIIEEFSQSPRLVSGTRNLADNISDLKAQVAANQKGVQVEFDLSMTFFSLILHAHYKLTL